MPPPPSPNETPLQAAAKLLERKTTFLEGCTQLHTILGSPGASAEHAELFKALQRAHTLLVSRYTSPSFWRAAHNLFRAASGGLGEALNTAQRQQLQVWEQEALSYLDEGSTSRAIEQQQQQQQQQQQGQQGPGSLLQSLLGLQGGPRSAFDDAGFTPEHQPQRSQQQWANQQGEQQLQEAGEARQQQQENDRQGQFMLDLLEGQQGLGGEQQEGEGEEEDEETPERQRLLDILRAIEAVQSGVGNLSRNTEAIRNELDAVIVALAANASEETAGLQRAAPPASKEAIAKLPLFTWDEARQEQQHEQGSVCAICTDGLQVGDQVQQLPCHRSHLFHPACLAPWLSKSNACPVCREELPTDDMNYEAEKEHRAEKEKEQRGAQNALGHNEFMYL